MVDGIEGDVLGGRFSRRLGCLDGRFRTGASQPFGVDGLCGGLGRFEFAINADVGILVETRIRFEARFGLGAALENTEIMVEETDVPLKAISGGVVFEGMGEFLGGFDEFTIGNAGCRPRLGEMVGVELQDFVVARVPADDDVFLVAAAFLDGVHRTPEEINISRRHEIAHTASRTRGNVVLGHVIGNDAFQTGNDACFQVL